MYRFLRSRAFPLLFSLIVVGDLLANNNFADRVDLGTAPGVSVVGTTEGADLEPGEFDPFSVLARGYQGTSCWYEWQAPSSGWFNVFVDPIGEGSPDMALVVGSGDAVESLNVLGYRWGFANEPGDLDITFPGQAGEKFVFSVLSNAPSGAVVFQLRIEPVAEPEVMIEGVSLSPSTVDVSGADQEISMSYTVRGAGSDPFVFPHLCSPDAKVCVPFLGSSPDQFFPVPQYSQPGFWNPEFSVLSGDFSAQFGRGRIFTDIILPTGNTDSVEITNTGSIDISPPHIVSASVDPEIVDVTNGEGGSVTLTVTIEDDPSGFGFSPLGGSLNFISSQRERDFAIFGEWTMVSGDDNRATYSITVPIGKGYPTGTYGWIVSAVDNAQRFGIYDGLGSLSGLPSAALASAQFSVVGVDSEITLVSIDQAEPVYGTAKAFEIRFQSAPDLELFGILFGTDLRSFRVLEPHIWERSFSIGAEEISPGNYRSLIEFNGDLPEKGFFKVFR